VLSKLAGAAGLPSDGAGVYHSDLRRVIPSSPAEPEANLVWAAMRAVYTGNTDIRFSCGNTATPLVNNADVVFYDVPWYRQLTEGPEDSVCFFEGSTGAGTMPPARRDVLNDVFFTAGTAWTRGYLSAERTCGTSTDFAVDAEQGGAAAFSATRWGAWTGTLYCANTSSNHHHIWVRPSTTPTM
jgi:hypothetical protein